MNYKNPHHRIRLNKTETTTLLEATRHALTCWKRDCKDCCDIAAYLKKLERYIEHRRT